VVLGISGW